MADNILRTATSVLGSFADWVGENNAAYLAYRRYGPDWQERLASDAQVRQERITQLRNASVISRHNVFQEEVDSLQKASEVIGQYASSLSPEDRAELAKAGIDPRADVAEDLDQGRGLINTELGAKHAKFFEQIANQDAAKQAAITDAYKTEAALDRVRMATEFERAETERARRPAEVEGLKAQAEQRREAAELNRDRQALVEAQTELEKAELSTKKGEGGRGSAARKRAQALLGGVTGGRNRILGIAGEIYAATNPDDAEDRAGTNAIQGSSVPGPVFLSEEEIPTPTYLEAVKAYRTELDNIATESELTEDINLDREGSDLPFEQEEAAELQQSIGNMIANQVPWEEWPQELKDALMRRR